MAPTPQQVLFRRAASCYGVFTRAAARSAGVTDRHLTRLVTDGVIERWSHGIYRVAGSPLMARTPLAAEVLASGGLASHRSAAELHGLLATVPKPPEILLLGDARHAGKALVRRTNALDRVDKGRAGGLPTTSLVRTLCDLAAVLPPFELEGVVHKEIAAGRVDPRRLHARAAVLLGRGRPGSAVMRSVLGGLADDAAPLESHVELRILTVLQRYGVRLPERQVEVHIDGVRYRLDFAYPAEKVFLEGDGYGWHTQRATFESDRARQNALVVAGWLPLRYTDHLLVRWPARAAAEVHAVLRARAAA